MKKNGKKRKQKIIWNFKKLGNYINKKLKIIYNIII